MQCISATLPYSKNDYISCIRFDENFSNLSNIPLETFLNVGRRSNPSLGSLLSGGNHSNPSLGSLLSVGKQSNTEPEPEPEPKPELNAGNQPNTQPEPLLSVGNQSNTTPQVIIPTPDDKKIIIPLLDPFNNGIKYFSILVDYIKKTDKTKISMTDEADGTHNIIVNDIEYKFPISSNTSGISMDDNVPDSTNIIEGTTTKGSEIRTQIKSNKVIYKDMGFFVCENIEITSKTILQIVPVIPTDAKQNNNKPIICNIIINNIIFLENIKMGLSFDHKKINTPISNINQPNMTFNPVPQAISPKKASEVILPINNQSIPAPIFNIPIFNFPDQDKENLDILVDFIKNTDNATISITDETDATRTMILKNIEYSRTDTNILIKSRFDNRTGKVMPSTLRSEIKSNLVIIKDIGYLILENIKATSKTELKIVPITENIKTNINEKIICDIIINNIIFSDKSNLEWNRDPSLVPEVILPIDNQLKKAPEVITPINNQLKLTPKVILPIDNQPKSGTNNILILFIFFSISIIIIIIVIVYFKYNT